VLRLISKDSIGPERLIGVEYYERGKREVSMLPDVFLFCSGIKIFKFDKTQELFDKGRCFHNPKFLSQYRDFERIQAMWEHVALTDLSK
jgi:hypothetical protein